MNAKYIQVQHAGLKGNLEGIYESLLVAEAPSRLVGPPHDEVLQRAAQVPHGGQAVITEDLRVASAAPLAEASARSWARMSWCLRRLL